VSDGLVPNLALELAILDDDQAGIEEDLFGRFEADAMPRPQMGVFTGRRAYARQPQSDRIGKDLRKGAKKPDTGV
jgi:hypothetical protein